MVVVSILPRAAWDMRSSNEMTIRKTHVALLQRVVYLLLLHVVDELSTRYFSIVISISFLN